MIKNNDQLQLKRDSYHILEFLGSGGQGIVWKVRRQSDGDELALKCVNIYQQEQLFKKHRKTTEIENLVVRAKEEIDFLHSLGQQAQAHYIVACVDDGIYRSKGYGDLPVMVMPLYAHDLEDYSYGYRGKQQPSPFTINDLLKWMQQTATALAFIHQHHNEQQPHVHRDIKLANLMLNAEGDIGLTDFGIARAMSHIGTSSVVATYFYCAPEQRFAIYHKKNFHKQYRITPAADCYSLGIAIHELIAGSTRAQDQISDRNKVDAHNGQLLPAGKKNSQKIGFLGEIGGLTAKEKSYVHRQIKALISPARQTLVAGVDQHQRLADDFADHLDTLLSPWLEDRPDALAIKQWCEVQQQALQARLDVLTLVMQTPTVTDGEQAHFTLSIKGQGLHQSLDWLTLLINEVPTDNYQCTGIENASFGYLQADVAYDLAFRCSLPAHDTEYKIRLVADIGQQSKSVETRCELRFSADHLWQLGQRKQALQQELREEWLDIIEQEAQNSSRKRTRLLDLLEELNYDLYDPKKKARYDRIDQIAVDPKPKGKRGRLWVGMVLLAGLSVGAYQFISGEEEESAVVEEIIDQPSVQAALIPKQEPSNVKQQLTELKVEQNAAEQEKEPARKPFEPEMVSIPAGSFKMGCVSGKDCQDDEKPLHTVNIKAFDMAKTEVTVKQYKACVSTGACQQPEWLEKGSDYHIKTGSNDLYKKLGKALTAGDYPIVGVSWRDASAYAKWLAGKTGKKYRLATEAEWEYAARAGTQTAYPWGNKLGKNKANCDKSHCGDKYQYTAPVGSFAAYMGLYDMNGNVWEWTCSAYEDKYEGSELVCANANDSRSRVLRGGSWFNYRRDVRSANRNEISVSNRYNSIGFRVVRTR